MNIRKKENRDKYLVASASFLEGKIWVSEEELDKISKSTEYEIYETPIRKDIIL